MTQPPETTGGPPGGGPGSGPPGGGPGSGPPGGAPGSGSGAPGSVPPPSSWHFPAPDDGQVPDEQAPMEAPATPLHGPGPGTPPPHGPAAYGPGAYGPGPYGHAPGPYRPAPAGPGPYPARYPGPAGGGRPAEPDLAEWWRRLLARLIDVVVVAIVLMPAAIALLYRWAIRLEQITSQYRDLSTPAARAALNHADSGLLVSWLLLIAVAAVVWFGYDSVQHGLWGQTLGKRALGTRVVSARDRSPIGGSAAAVRAAVYALPPLVPLLGSAFSLLNELWLLWDPRRQCLHDKAARTIVVRTAVPPPNGWR